MLGVNPVGETPKKTNIFQSEIRPGFNPASVVAAVILILPGIVFMGAILFMVFTGRLNKDRDLDSRAEYIMEACLGLGLVLSLITPFVAKSFRWPSLEKVVTLLTIVDLLMLIGMFVSFLFTGVGND